MTTSDVIFTSWHPRTLLNETAGSQPAPEELRQQARNDGYMEGYNEGLEAGKKESLALAHEKVVQLQSLIDALDKPFKKLELEISEYLLSLISVICSSVLRKELSTDIGHIQTTLNRALEMLSEEQRSSVNLTLHPDDAAFVKDNWSEEFGDLNIRPSEEITRGGCLLQRNDSLVDATIESQLRKIILDLAHIPGPVNPSGETADPLDAKQIVVTSGRLEQGANRDE